MQELTLGSLFDGIGGFCYAAYLTGRIKPIWAAEIEQNCIDITRYRFPEVMHVGSVTELKGDEIQPVDIITFGSPCQDLSIAGQRKGLKGNRSGLFMEAIRIIEEMRLATNGKYPTFIIWENVPGAFSSANGADFRAVLVQNMGRGGGQTPCVMYEESKAYGINAKSIIVDEESTGTLSTYCGNSTNRNVIAIEKKSVIPLRDEVTRNKASNGLGVGKAGGPCPTLTTADVHSVFYEAYQHNGYRESEISGTLTTDQNSTIRGDTPLVVRTDRKTFELNQHGGYREAEVNGTLRAAGGDYGGGSETIVTEKYRTKENTPSKPKSIKDILKRAVQKVTYIIRRLTPVECERLQGYPDNWTKYGADGTEIADTARYRAIGNSICVYCAERVYLGILDALEEEADNGRG